MAGRMPCPDCNKFTPYGEQEPEVQGERIENDEEYQAEVRAVLPCEECGTELKEYNFEFQIQIDHECEGEFPEDEERFEIEEEASVIGTDRREKSKRLFGVNLMAKIKCNCCGEVFEVSEQQEMEAKHFDELI